LPGSVGKTRLPSREFQDCGTPEDVPFQSRTRKLAKDFEGGVLVVYHLPREN